MITFLSTKTNNILGEKALDASLDALKNSTKKAERRRTSETLRQTETSSLQDSSRNPKKSFTIEGGNTPRNSTEQDIVITIRPDVLRQLKHEESEVTVSPATRSSLPTAAVSQCSSRCVTPHSIVSGPMKDIGEERKKKIRSMVRSLEEDGHANFCELL